MAQWHFDANTYGAPSTPVSQTQIGQFQQGLGNVGRGQYFSYNPTGSVPVTLLYQWDGDTLAQFRQDWSDPGKLNYGANWFTADLPLMLDYSEIADTSLYPPNQRMDNIYAVEIGEDDLTVGFQSDYNGTISYGDIQAKRLMGVVVQSAYVSGTDRFVMRFDTSVGEALPFPNEEQLDVHFIETDERLTLNRSGEATSYSTRMDIDATQTVLDWRASIGQTRTISVRPYMPSFQRYRTHVTTPFQPIMAGYDRWNVTIQVEVDMSPKLVIST